MNRARKTKIRPNRNLESSLVRILLVTAGERIVPGLAAILRDFDYAVVDSVSSREAAVERAVRLRPDLLLIDVGRNGESEATQIAGEVRKVHDLPIICLTEPATGPVLVRSGAPGADAYLSRPFRASDLRSAIEIALYKHQMEARLREAEKLREIYKAEAVARLAGGVAHVFNNLLMVILGHAELLLANSAADDELKTRTVKIKEAVKQAAMMTHQLTAFASRQTLSPKLLDLNSVFAQTLPSLSKRLAQQGIEYRVAAARGPACVRIDPIQLHEVTQALVTNATDAMPSGGKLTVTIDFADLREEDDPQRFGLTAGRYVTLELSDTGHGITKEVRARLFEPFFSTKELGKGSGLHLAAVYGIANQNGGSVTVESGPGTGAAFKVFLPRAETADSATAAAGDELSSEELHGSETILLVEDQEKVRSLTREFLRGLGYNVLDAGHGEEAVRLARSFNGKIHVLLTDLLMPGMNGRQLARGLKAIRPGIKVVYVSGYADEAFQKAGAPDPEDVLLEKPFSFTMLAQTIRETVERLPDKNKLAAN